MGPGQAPPGASLRWGREGSVTCRSGGYRHLRHWGERVRGSGDHPSLRHLSNIKGLWNQLQSCDADSGLGGYRLVADPCFLKLCPRVVFDPDSLGFVRAIHILLGHWHWLAVGTESFPASDWQHLDLNLRRCERLRRDGPACSACGPARYRACAASSLKRSCSARAATRKALRRAAGPTASKSSQSVEPGPTRASVSATKAVAPVFPRFRGSLNLVMCTDQGRAK